jgi:hypothetical protein
MHLQVPFIGHFGGLGKTLVQKSAPFIGVGYFKDLAGEAFKKHEK